MRPFRRLLPILSLALIAFTAGGCAVPKTPAEAVSSGPVRRPPTSGYLASLIILDLNTDYGVALAVEPQTSTLPTGDIVFVVLNKWHGLAPGPHSEAVVVLAADGLTAVYETATDFEADSSAVSVTIAEPMAMQVTVPGLYWVAVKLDGAEVVRYPFRVIDTAD